MAGPSTGWVTSALVHALGLGFVCTLGCGPAKLGGSGSETQGSTDTDPTADDDDDLSSSSDGDDDSEETSESGNPSGFVPERDGGPTPTCDMFAQDCPEGEKCVPNFGGSPDFRCVPVDGDKGVGESCIHDGNELGTDDCDIDSHCWLATETDGELVGVCIPFCSGTPDNPGDCGSGPGCDGYDCHVYGQVGIPICEPRCNPLADECPDGYGCSLDYQGSFTCWVLYEPVAAGEPCEWDNSCEPGSLCIDGTLLPDCGEGNCCAPVCDLADPEAAAIDCAGLPGSTCVDMLDAQDVGCAAVGLCMVPG